MNDDRRAAMRRPLHVPVSMGSGAFVCVTRAADISSSGICLIGDQQFRAGSVWRLEFRLPSARGPVRIAADARVVYSILATGQGWKSGLQFSRLSQDEADAIAAFVRRS
jgi:hypothetical protein